MNMDDPRRATWEAGNYSTAADQSILPSELLCEAVDLRAGETVLDVACGTGVTSLAAARRQTQVTGIDFSESSLTIARQRTRFEELPISFQEANAEALPFEDAIFDVVLSSFGAQFVGDQQAAASELLRVCRPGGRIGLTNWTPGPYFGHFFKLLADYAPKTMLKSPTPEKPGVLWGTEARLHELFGDRVEYRQITERISRTRARSINDWVAGITDNLGPAITILQQIDAERQRAFVADLRELATRNNTVPGPDLLLESRYLEVVLVRC